MARYRTEPAYEGMKLAREDKIKSRQPTTEQVKARQLLKKLKKKRKKGR